ncbi:ABC transporter ATP-binding protein [Leuconostoc miyukkimchii]|uniref:ABC transporter ATP-binding protein n=1 Tax=Leuconostoc miyukkimchii TaxID=910540 RepID=UPI001C7E163F|nr:ATP-binding cassette domain-containing protein [Leuconostoc miyukkimchii]
MDLNSEYVLTTDHLTKKYGTQISVNNLSIHLKKGQIYGLLGKNGAGKSTTMKMILGLIKPSSGIYSLFGKDMSRISNSDLKTVLARVGNTIESPGFYPNLTGTENLRIFARLRKLPEGTIEDSLKKLKLPYKDKKLFSEYSLGMKQRLAIANATMNSPELLILDEPINGLDPEGIVDIRKLLIDLSQNHGTTILISSHILSEIQLVANDIGIIDNGALLIESSLKELIEQNSNSFIFKASNSASIARAAKILEQQFKLRDVTIVDEQTLSIGHAITNSAEVIKTFINNDIDIQMAYLEEGTLENYFKSITNEGSHND